jgi:two-component system nitrate/nitrite response regulator NarL
MLCSVDLRCLIVDDNAQFLEAAGELLQRDGIDVVGVASTIVEALQKAGELRPDVYLVDIDLGGESGFDLAQRLAAAPGLNPSQVILTSTYAEMDLTDLVEASPAAGFVSKSKLSGRALREAIAIDGRRDLPA